MTTTRRWMLVGTWCVGFSIAVSADTLVMRDGRRIEGEVISMRDGVIEFEARRGGLFGSRERGRIDRSDVARIEFDDRAGRTDLRDDRTTGRDDRPSTGRPSGLRERDVSVDARAQWSDTGIEVRSGQALYFSATGRVRWGPSRQDGPAGERGSPRNPNRPIPSRPAAGLIGRVGDSNDYFFIGDEEGPIRIRGGGRLFLGVNDDFLQDNSGAFRVTVYY